MKLTREIAQAHAARLLACPMLCPQSAEGVREVIDCLIRHCEDQAHAERTMTALLESSEPVRGPIDAIVRWAWRTRNTDGRGRAQIWDHEAGCWVLLDERQAEMLR